MFVQMAMTIVIENEEFVDKKRKGSKSNVLCSIVQNDEYRKRDVA